MLAIATESPELTHHGPVKSPFHPKDDSHTSQLLALPWAVSLLLCSDAPAEKELDEISLQ